MVQDIKERHNKKLNHIKGRWGEEITSSYLESNGYIIVERNYRCYYGEIDIIAYNGDMICFIEVKMRNSTSFGIGSESISYTKINRIKRSAQYFLNKTVMTKTGNRFGIRFDVCEITKYKGIYYCKLIKNAF